MHSGQQIREYVLDSKIGEGGMGQVWRARHLTLDRKVAIKVMSTHIATDPEFEKRFVQEARAQANLNHPRILGVNDFFIEDQVYYLVMPLIEGESLEVLMDRAAGPLPTEQVETLAHDLLDALDYAHRKGIIHRDVKPSNILLDSDGRAYLMDFGIALLVGKERRTRTGTSLGTPHYMSPEQIRSPKTIDHRTDVYSIGCVLYEALAGRPPFLPAQEHGDTDYQIKEAHLYEQATPIRQHNPSVPEGFDRIVMRALTKDPAQRYGGCGEFLRALNAYRYQGVTPPPLPTPVTDPGRSTGPGRPVTVPAPVTQPPVAPAPPKKPGSKTFWLAVGGGAVGCLVIAAGLFVLLVAIGMMEETDESPAVVEQPPVETLDPSPADNLTTLDDPAPEPIAPPPSRSTRPASRRIAAPAGHSAGNISEAFRNQIEGQLTAGGLVYTAAGFEETHDQHVGRLDPGENITLDFELAGEASYSIFGVCDSDCSDLDLWLYDENDNLIDSDVAVDDFPLVTVTPEWTGPFSLRVRLIECDAPFCYYGVSIHGSQE